MKKIFYTTALLLLSSISASAQIHHPEFWLEMKWFANGKPSPNRTIAFGYSPLASDSLGQTNKNPPDSTWLDDIIPGGEQQSPGPSFGDYIAFTGFTTNRAYLGTGSYVDIRQKPSQTSFSLAYEISLYKDANTTSYTFLWDKSKIPSIINHIIIEPGTVDPKTSRKTDMKQVSQFDLPNKDSIGKYQKMLITLYYNKVLGVEENSGLTTNSLDVSVSPSPMSQKALVNLRSQKEGTMSMQVYDALGRQVFERSVYAIAGANYIELNRTSFPTAGTYYIRASVVSSGKMTTAMKAFQVY